MSNLEDVRLLLDKKTTVEEACSSAGVSRQTYYNWLNSLSESDKEAEKKFPGFHTFSEEREQECANCTKKFQTRLKMNRFCSWSCRPYSKEGELRRQQAGLQA